MLNNNLPIIYEYTPLDEDNDSDCFCFKWFNKCSLWFCFL